MYSCSHSCVYLCQCVLHVCQCVYIAHVSMCVYCTRASVWVYGSRTCLSYRCTYMTVNVYRHMCQHTCVLCTDGPERHGAYLLYHARRVAATEASGPSGAAHGWSWGVQPGQLHWLDLPFSLWTAVLDVIFFFSWILTFSSSSSSSRLFLQEFHVLCKAGKAMSRCSTITEGAHCQVTTWWIFMPGKPLEEEGDHHVRC